MGGVQGTFLARAVSSNLCLWFNPEECLQELAEFPVDAREDAWQNNAHHPVPSQDSTVCVSAQSDGTWQWVVLSLDAGVCHALDLGVLVPDCLVHVWGHYQLRLALLNSANDYLPLRHSTQRSQEARWHEDLRSGVQETLFRLENGFGRDIFGSCLPDYRIDGRSVGILHLYDQRADFVHQRGHLILVPAVVCDYRYQVHLPGIFRLQDFKETFLHEFSSVRSVLTVHNPYRLSQEHIWGMIGKQFS